MGDQKKGKKSVFIPGNGSSHYMGLASSKCSQLAVQRRLSTDLEQSVCGLLFEPTCAITQGWFALYRNERVQESNQRYLLGKKHFSCNITEKVPVHTVCFIRDTFIRDIVRILKKERDKPLSFLTL